MISPRAVIPLSAGSAVGFVSTAFSSMRPNHPDRSRLAMQKPLPVAHVRHTGTPGCAGRAFSPEVIS